MENYNGYGLEKIEIGGMEAVIVHPKKPNGKWALKTEYFPAFPGVQLKLLELGYYVAHVTSKTRWYCEEDNKRRAELAEYMIKNYGVSEKCVIIGMSCGGMQGIYFATDYPQYVSVLYLDAPVVNFLSCPAGIGKGRGINYQEFADAKGMSLEELISFRDHPLDRLPKLAKLNIPVCLVCGDSDGVVPYDENGIYIKKAYEEAGAIIETHLKPGCDHHPHSLEDNTPIIDFILKYDIQ